MTKYHDKCSFQKKVFDLGSKFQRVVAYLDLRSGSLAAGRCETGTAAETTVMRHRMELTGNARRF